MITKYGQIAHELREQIASGQYEPGSTLPSIPELMAHYEVARDTIRDAVGLLAREGLVVPRRGIGTVVRAIAPVALSYEAGGPARTWDEQTGDAGRDDVVLAEWTSADVDIAERLGIAPEARVVHRVRHFTLGPGLAQISEQWIPQDVADAVQAAGNGDLAGEQRPDAGGRNLFELFAAAGFPPAEINEAVSTRMPDPDERDTMEIPVDIPVLVTRRITRDADHRALETTTAVGAGDRMTARFIVPVHY